MTAPSERERIEAALAKVLDGRQARVAGIDPRIGELSAHLVRFVLGGGKRLRPRFALAGWAAVPGAQTAPVPDGVVRAAAALELVQACALVHDDIVDASDTRRGNPTVHRAVEAGHAAAGWSGDAARYGISQAILLGDLALSWADEMFAGCGADAPALDRARGPWAEMKTDVLAGQMLDVLAEASGAEDEETARRVNRFKTAAYTVERPLQIGAALAGAPDAAVDALRRYGVAVGIAFQLRDDLLGVFGDPEVTGKPSGDDIREGKRTLLVATALHRAPTAEAAELRSALGTRPAPDTLERVRSILHSSGAVAAVESEVDRLGTEALAALARADLDPAGRDRLVELAAAATQRSH